MANSKRNNKKKKIRSKLKGGYRSKNHLRSKRSSKSMQSSKSKRSRKSMRSRKSFASKRSIKRGGASQINYKNQIIRIVEELLESTNEIKITCRPANKNGDNRPVFYLNEKTSNITCDPQKYIHNPELLDIFEYDENGQKTLDIDTIKPEIDANKLDELVASI